MTGRPAMILQFAHFLSNRYTKAHEKPAEVYVQSSISINGRKAQALIDPRVNLAAIKQKEFNNSWILPLRQPVWNARHKKNRFGAVLFPDEDAKKALLLSAPPD